jgi:hypothetical protein
MNETPLVERVGIVSPVPTFGRVGSGVAAVLAALLTALVVGQMLGWDLSSSGAAGLLAVSTVSAAGAVWLAVRALRSVGREVRFHDSVLEVVTVGLMGRQRDVVSVPYDEIDLVVRAQLRADGSETAADYAVFHGDEDSPLIIGSVADPHAFEQAAKRRVESPNELAWHVEDEYGRRKGVESARVFWREWPVEKSIPTSVVVDQSAVPSSIWTVTEEDFKGEHDALNWLAYYSLGQGYP